MELVATASLITAFVAGFAALLAPCCVGVLMPAYLASVFKSRTKIFLMTFIYFLGILTIYLPLGLGIASLSSFFSTNHAIVFTIGGLFMLTLGIFMLLGKSIMLPIKVHPHIDKHDFGSIYLLGIFSGVATTCCAPVLAGVLALSAMPGSVWLGGAYALTFVIGMVVPLFLMAVAFDRSSLINKVKLLRRRVSYSLFNSRISINISHLISGILYVVFGLFILIFERVNPDAFGSGYQLQINLWAAKVTRFISNITDSVPETVWAVFFVLIFVGFGRLAYHQLNHKENKSEEE